MLLLLIAAAAATSAAAVWSFFQYNTCGAFDAGDPDKKQRFF